jgi:hypothetical protein
MILVAAVPLLNSGLLNPYMAFCFGWLKPLASNRICLRVSARIAAPSPIVPALAFG